MVKKVNKVRQRYRKPPICSECMWFRFHDCPYRSDDGNKLACKSDFLRSSTAMLNKSKHGMGTDY